MMATRVLVADDHTIFREGLRLLLERLPDVVVAGETGDGREALDLIDRLRPDIAILDIQMPGLSGLEVAKRSQLASPSTRVVILSMHTGEAYVANALRARVAAYLVKECAAAELASAIRAVQRGEFYLSPAISRHVVEGFLHGAHDDADPLAELSLRQREVLQLLVEGKANKEIAADLGLSVKTVEAHRAHLMERLGIHTVPGLVRVAIRAGLVISE